MKALEATNLVICVRNEGHELDRERWGVYEAIPDESLVDETGEDYIYPTNYFASAEHLKRRRPWVIWGRGR